MATTNDFSQCRNCFFRDLNYAPVIVCDAIDDGVYLQWKLEECPYHIPGSFYSTNRVGIINNALNNIKKMRGEL